MRGRISKKWGRAYQLYSPSSSDIPINATPWATQVILAIWNFSAGIWKFRNGVKHGHTVERAIAKELYNLQQLVRQEFELYDADPHIVSAQYRHLYLGKELAQRLQMGRDSLNSWLRSVREAKRHQENLRASLTKITSQFLMPRRQLQSTVTQEATSAAAAASQTELVTPLSDNLKLHEIDPG